MSKTPSPHIQMESWATLLPISSFINFGIVYIWPIYQSLDKRTWFTILFCFFISKRVALCSKYWFFLGGASTSICHFFHPSVRRVRYLRNRASSNRRFWYTCVKYYLQVVFFCCCYCCCFFLFILIFRATRVVKVQKIAQNEK